MSKKKEKSSAEILQERIATLKDEWNWRYSSGIEYDYDTYHPCNDGSDCCNNDYCRCGVITNARVISLDPVKVAEAFTKDLKDEILSYCVDRIIVASGLMDKECWEVIVEGGYYGQEVHGVKPDESVSAKVESSLLELLKAKNDFEALKMALEAEYGYLLPSLNENKYNVSVMNVPINQVRMGNDDYMRKVDKKTLEFYAEYSLPRAVCIAEKSVKPYRLIDGYHRTTAAYQNKLEEIKIILLEKVK